MKRKIIRIPEEIITESKLLLSTNYYKNSKTARDIIRKLIGKCSRCDEIASTWVLEKRDGIQVIERYCSEHG